MKNKIKDKWNTQGQNVLLAAFLAILMLLLLCIGVYIINRLRQQSAAAPQILTVPTPKYSLAPSARKIYFPVITFEVFKDRVVTSPKLEDLPTQIPLNLWKVAKIYPQSYSLRGYVYDVGAFENVSTGEAIKGFCANPGRPAPNPGDLYSRNEWNVLIPINNDNPPWKQKFIVIDK
jgi:hypothetical protein